jgi:hypothetical protein
MAAAVRALAVARSVADAGVVPGAGAALHAVARTHDSDEARDPLVATLVQAAACEPYRRIQLTVGVVGGAVDSVATVRGALGHAAATAGRYLSEV